MGLFRKRFSRKYQGKLSEEIQLRFLKRLLQLLITGYPLIDALQIIKWDKELVKATEEVIDTLKSGGSLDKALENANFHQSITAYLYFVRETGDLKESIQKCIEMYEDRLKYVKQFEKVARYPLILLFVFVILMYFIQTAVLPSFAELFQSNKEVSTTIFLSIKVIDYLKVGIFILLFISITLYVMWLFYREKLNIEKKIKLYQSIPVFRKYILLQTSFQFATHLSALLKTGKSLKDILHNMSRQKKLPILAYYSTLMIKELEKGLPIATFLPQLYFLAPQFTTIFQKNTDKNALEKDLSVYADLLTEELQRKVMKVLLMIQPIFFLLLACFVIFIYLTLMLPMYQLIENL